MTFWALGERGHWGKSNLYGECTQVPLVMAGPDVGPGATCDTPVNLIDLAPTFLSAFGFAETALPGRSLFEIAREPADPARSSFSEYHAVGAPSGAFILRSPRSAATTSEQDGSSALLIFSSGSEARSNNSDGRALVERFGGRKASADATSVPSA